MQRQQNAVPSMLLCLRTKYHHIKAIQHKDFFWLDIHDTNIEPQMLMKLLAYKAPNNSFVNYVQTHDSTIARWDFYLRT